ncbi:uncharacterized protein ANIA_00217 [Aspergillus nidulans FGSC A4]|uniref:Phosphate permease (AFU_orthologue AFUA_5G01320) n=1 Tax=Emericella nidulans (strain FGSC A4 / ATCC 38163 / CBS 112.46 / NRRL 194 / M139) TaxID=227321 RepID=C8VUU3_EMENI|nr:hypothetical protein [Aspergillus nidulans FGSC A4]CBF89954.1 TPA: phosphate permease (AFU_orthologue; AFUA_5G01320) [Aspergillus nidulans FGSC A4]
MFWLSSYLQHWGCCWLLWCRVVYVYCGLLIFWRFFMGVGLGGDYSLSAVICSEFAPTRIRGWMPAAVFCCQSLGSLAANMVALIAVAGFHHRLLEDDSGAGCTGRCVQDVDRIWRLIVGLGAVPEFIALWFRLTTIGSPRYTAEVTQNSLQAAADVSYFFRPDEAIPAPEMGQITATIVISPATTEPVLYPSSVNSTRSSVSEVTPTVDLFSIQPKPFRVLMATCLGWFFLDLPLYGPGLISPHSMVVVSSGAVVGNLIAIFTIDRLGRRNIQLNGFFWLYILNIVVGTSFCHPEQRTDSSALVVYISLCQIFNFGPNTTTYILPAELFATRLRCTCHGLAAAAGKLGSVIAHIFISFVDYGSAHTIKMILGTCWGFLFFGKFADPIGLHVVRPRRHLFLRPDVRDSDGKIKSLEKLADDLMSDSGPLPETRGAGGLFFFENV